MTNIIIGIFIGIIFEMVLMMLICLWMDRDTANRIKKDLSEDFELVVIPKSDVEKVREFLAHEDMKNIEIRPKTPTNTNET